MVKRGPGLLMEMGVPRGSPPSSSARDSGWWPLASARRRRVEGSAAGEESIPPQGQRTSSPGACYPRPGDKIVDDYCGFFPRKKGSPRRVRLVFQGGGGLANVVSGFWGRMGVSGRRFRLLRDFMKNNLLRGRSWRCRRRGSVRGDRPDTSPTGDPRRGTPRQFRPINRRLGS
jgi:hypothetical protein